MTGDPAEDPPPAKPGRLPLTQPVRERITAAAIVLAMIAACIICLALAQPFLPALTWALALAVLFAPLYRWLLARVPYPNAAAALMVVFIAVVILVPLFLVGSQLVIEASNGVQLLQKRLQSDEIERLTASYPWLAPIGQWLRDSLDLPAIMTNLATTLSNLGASLVRMSLVQAAQILGTLFFLFFFLRDGRQALEQVRRHSPLSPALTEEFLAKSTDTIIATVFGTLMMALIQGALGGLIFLILGLSGAFLWGAVMGLLAIVPALGAFVVWVPAALYLALEGNWLYAVIMAAWGALVVGTIDNVLYPVLVGRRLRLHTALTFLSVVGGIVLFGSPGLVLGPLALSTAFFVLRNLPR